MKKIVGVILVLVLVLGMIGCGEALKEPEPTATPAPTAAPKPTATPKPQKMSESKAISIAKEDVESSRNYLAIIANCSKIDMFSIGDATAEYNEKTNGYNVTVKGHFWAVDEYGNTGGRYNFTWKVPVYADGSSAASLAAAAGRCTIDKS